MFQGLGAGGEWDGAVLLAVEHPLPGRRGLFCSWAQMGVPTDLLLGNGVLLPFASLLPEEQFFSWGWRVPFLAGIVLIAVGLFVRPKIMESPAFRQVQESHTEALMPVVDVVRYYPRKLPSSWD